MPIFSHGPIEEIPTDSETVFAFRVAGHIDDDASEALANFMNNAFDQHAEVNMLLELSKFAGSDWDSLLDDAVIKSRLRALKHVKRYAVVGAPEKAAKMIALMDKIIPVQARAFDTKEIADAWGFVGAQPKASGAAT